MRKFALIFSIVTILVFMLVISACNKASEPERVPMEQATATTAEPTSEATNPVTTVQPAKSESVQYTTESDELEILSPNQGDNSGDKTPEPDTEEPAKPQTTSPQVADPVPTMGNISDEPIELPFVPIG